VKYHQQPDELRKEFLTMKTSIWIVLGILVMISLACNVILPVERMQAGELQTLNISEPAAQAPMKVTISMGAGSLEINGGGTGLVEGSIHYNVPEWKPTVSYQGNELTIQQGTNYGNKLPPENIANDWNLKFGQSPIDLTINAGAYDSQVDLSDVPVTNLSINDGASNVKVVFNSPNPEKMQLLSYKTGASTIKLIGLGNANFSEMSFSGGAGDYTLDFSGKLSRDGHVTISSGASQVNVIIPKDMNCVVTVAGAINDVVSTGEWSANGNTYTHQGQGPMLSISAEVSVGSLKIISQ
jgi:hypothetical protein